MKTSNLIKICILVLPGLLSTTSALARNYSNDQEDCIKTLSAINDKAQSSCASITENDIRDLRLACFCAPVQGNSSSGVCDQGDDAELNITSNGYGGFFEVNANGCHSDQYLSGISNNKPKFEHPVNFCAVSYSQPSYQAKNEAWLHKTEFTTASGKKITMEDLRKQLATSAKNASCTRIQTIDDSFNLHDESKSNVLYITQSEALNLNGQTFLGSEDEPAIIFGNNINVSYINEQRRAHILASGTLTVDHGVQFIGGLNAHKLNYIFETGNVQQRIFTPKSLTDNQCTHCYDLQKIENEAWRLTQISGANACEQVILQLEKCTSGNSECTAYTGTDVSVTSTVSGGAQESYTPDANGRIYLKNATYNRAFTAVLKENSTATKAYCSSSDTTASDSCSFTGAECNASLGQSSISGYIGEQLPLSIELEGNVLSALRGFNDDTTDNSKTIIAVSVALKTTQDIAVTNSAGTITKLTVPEDADAAEGEIDLPNANVKYDAEHNKTIISTTMTVNSLALDYATKSTELTYIKLRASSKLPPAGTEETTLPDREFYFALTSGTTLPVVRTAPAALCITIDNSDTSKPYILETDRNYKWTQKAVGCTGALCPTANKAPTQLELSQICAANTQAIPLPEIAEWQRNQSLQPLYKTTFTTWLQNPAATNVVPASLTTEDKNLKYPYASIEAVSDNNKLALGFTGTDGTNKLVSFTDNGWISFSSYAGLKSIPERTTYFYSPVYTVVPTYLYPNKADIYNFYDITDSEDIKNVPDDLSAFESLNTSSCPEYYNEHFLLRIILNGFSATDRTLKNIRGAMVDNSKNEIDFTGFRIKEEDEENLENGTGTNASLQEETNFQKLAMKIKDWEAIEDLDGNPYNAYMQGDQKFSLPGQNAEEKTIFLAIVGRSYLCEAPQTSLGSFDCDIPVYTQNKAELPDQDVIDSNSFANELKDYFGLAQPPRITGLGNSINGLKDTTPGWKNIYITFLHVENHSGPVLKKMASGRLVSIPVTGSTDTLYVPYTIQYLDRSGNWKVRADSCTTLNLAPMTVGIRNLPPNVFFKTAKDNYTSTDNNGKLIPTNNEEVNLAFCSTSKTNCNNTSGNFAGGVLWMQAKHTKGNITNDSYGILNFKFNPTNSDNKNIEHLLDNTTSRGGFLFRHVKNNMRIINKERD